MLIEIVDKLDVEGPLSEPMSDPKVFNQSARNPAGSSIKRESQNKTIRPPVWYMHYFRAESF